MWNLVFGQQIATSFTKSQKVPLNIEIFIEGLTDGVADVTSKFEKELMQNASILSERVLEFETYSLKHILEKDPTASADADAYEAEALDAVLNATDKKLIQDYRKRFASIDNIADVVK